MEHGPTKTACEAAGKKNFPQSIKNHAALFVEYQKKRHDADYNPYANTENDTFTKADILDMIEQAKQAIEDMKAASPDDRKAFSAFVLLRPQRW